MHISFGALRSRRWTLPGAALAIAGALTFSACGGSGGSTGASGLTKVKVRTDVFYTGAVLPLLAGVDKGIYKKHGLDVTLNPGKGSATTLQTVANGSDDLGYADGGALVQAAGKGMPVEMVAGMVQRSPLAPSRVSIRRLVIPPWASASATSGPRRSPSAPGRLRFAATRTSWPKPCW